MRISESLLFLIASLSAANSATMSLHAIDGATAQVTVEGAIANGDSNSLQALMESSRAAGLKVVSVSFNSPGGDLAEGYKLATEIKGAQLATEVERSNICASACFFAFAAGATKTIAPNARIGVHGAADTKGIQSPDAASATIAIARWAVKELGIPSDIIGKMVTTPPSNIVWLSASELKSMGVHVGDRTQSVSAGSIPVDFGAEGGPDPSRGWPDLVRSAIDLSKVQNGGVVQANHLCVAITGACEWSVNFQLAGGRLAALQTIQDRNGQTVSRAYCVIEPSADARHCMDWDTRRRSEERKGADGHWARVN